MAVTFVASGTHVTGSDVTTLVPGIPAGLVAGDLMVCLQAVRSASVRYTAPATWSTITGVLNGGTATGPTIAVSTRVFVAGDTAPTFTRNVAGTGVDAFMQIHAYRGAGGGVGPYGVEAKTGTGTATTIGPIPGVTVQDGGIVLIHACQMDDFGTPTVPTGWTVRTSQESIAGNDASWFVYEQAFATGGTSPAVTLSSAPTAAAANLGCQIAILPTGTKVYKASAFMPFF
jgi:hypothetical protein